MPDKKIGDPRLGSTSLTTGREDDEKGRGDDKSQKRGDAPPFICNKFAFSWFCFVYYPTKVVFLYPIAAKIGCGLWKCDFSAL